MDPRERADAALARARARGAFVVTPESAVSPMDAANTLQLPRIVIADNDERRQDDPDATLVVPIAEVRENTPAIAQEALTDVVGSTPGIRSRQRRLEDAIARSAAARQLRAEAEANQQPPARQQAQPQAPQQAQQQVQQQAPQQAPQQVPQQAPHEAQQPHAPQAQQPQAQQPQAQQPQAPQAQPQPSGQSPTPQPAQSSHQSRQAEAEELEGIIPTTKRQPAGPGSLSERLEG